MNKYDAGVSAQEFADALKKTFGSNYYGTSLVWDHVKPEDAAKEHLPKRYIDDLRLWQCHYCGSAQPDDLYKCANCGGERR